jgi:hypothetical protein
MHEKALSLLACDPSTGLDVVTIPVVVHVVYRTAEDNISDDQVESQIAALNRDFRARIQELAAVPFPFRPLAGDARIEFRLAAEDPNKRPTTGITRTRTRRKAFDYGDAIKSRAKGGADPWDPQRYLNIWVGAHVDGMTGYAQFPGNATATDGVVVSVKAFGTLGSARAPFDLGRTTSHTVGHYLGLQHTWVPEGRLADVPVQQAPSFGTPTFPKISGNNGPFGDMYMNFMDYVDDAAMVMFTKHQVLQMRDTLRRSRSLLGGEHASAPPAARPRSRRTKQAPPGETAG